jgi:hypothetical protein
MRILLSIILLVTTLPVMAEPPALEPPAFEPLPTTALPQTGPVGEDMEPEVKIIKKDKATIHEYRMNGVLYMVKIIPGFGPPYYLIDGDGDGYLESRHNEIEPGVPQWMLYRW